MPKIIIDGKEIEFKPGQTVIQAAVDNGIDVPHFCWHPALSVSGNCRMCLVEIENMPKLAIACSTNATDGMVVKVNSDKAVQARNSVMEFILINHPLDCPICDEAGECKLQDYTYKYSVGESRFTEEKQHNKKRELLGPRVMFDAERCIACSRCIRFCDEVAKENQLTFTQRGDRVTITHFPDQPMDNNYSLNTTDICPVGALTNKDFRFKARVWDMSHTNSVCSGCSRGCNTEIWTRNNEILRLTPRFNGQVNSYWMCDHGRLETFKFVNSSDRVDGPYIKKSGQQEKSGWTEAYDLLSSALRKYKSHEMAFIGSGLTTLENNYALAKFARGILGCQNLDFAQHLVPGSGDDILIREDKAPNALGAKLAGVVAAKNGLELEAILKAARDGKIKALIIMEDDLADLGEEAFEALNKVEFLAVFAVNHDQTARMAHVLLPAASYAEQYGTFVNFEGVVQRIRPAVTTNELDRALDGMNMSRLDKFGTIYDRWGNGRRLDAKPAWKILSELSGYMGAKWRYQMAEEVFDDLAQEIPQFKGLDYDKLGDSGVKIK